MKLPIINQNDSEFGKEKLGEYYKNKMIPAEKKTYLTDLKHCTGPYLGIKGSDGKTHYLLDAASQIATLGHGFNPSVFFGTSQFLESWTNDTSTKEFKNMRLAFINFLKRKLGWKKTHITFVHSGAEANETALGYCYKSRVNPNANKVLAFEGSFHGRMMVTLAATWNKSKREPFEWKNYLAQYVPYPDLPDSHIHVDFPAQWKETWNEATKKDFQLPEAWSNDPTLKKEIHSLTEIRKKLLTKEIFAILVEPMQCEGGDCYSSDRFHTALLLMAKTFKVPVIHDEVQTGFHLGREFFWHRQLNLKGLNGEQINPDYVVCAKKAQVGLVISHKETKAIFKGEELSVASAFRGYAHAVSLDQTQSQILQIEEKVKPLLTKLIEKYPTYISKPRTNGMAFAFDLNDPTMLNKFVDLRFKHGLLYYPAGNQTLRFRLNTAFKTEDYQFLFERLEAIIRELFLNEVIAIPSCVETPHSPSEKMYEWHEELIQIKLDKIFAKKINHAQIFQKFSKKFKETNNLSLIEINKNNYNSFRNQILKIQQSVYEEARQTDIEKFDVTITHKNSIALGLINDKNELKAIAFAGPLGLYPLERGLRSDPHFNEEDSLYMLDLTVLPEYQGTGLGKELKYTVSALGITKGIKRIQGRNRDRLASAMLNINLSLGAVEQNYITEDYPDFEKYRDVFYYTSSTDWKKPLAHLSKAVQMPFSIGSMNQDFIQRQMPFLINKVCLSNFVSENFLSAIKDIVSILPEELRHAYTTSGQSESVDKVIKTIWVKSESTVKEKNLTKMLTFKGHFFGNGSMLSRSLSLESDPYFDVFKLNNPNENNYSQILNDVEAEFKTNLYLATWIEPVLQKTMEKIPYEFLKGLRELCTKYNVALIYNETASQSYRYSLKQYFVSNFADISPDAGLIYMSGQSGMVFVSDKYFLEQPLMMISTWDGDEFHLLNYHHAFKKITANFDDFKITAQKFQAKLIDQLSQYELDAIKIEHGYGYFKGALPQSLSKFFTHTGNHFILCPSYDAMKEYLES